MRVTSAASMATSVPEPIAMPTSAWARAGASLMPSPTMATQPAVGLQRRTSRRLAVRQHLGEHAARCRPGGRWPPPSPAVAGEHDHLKPAPAEPRPRPRRLRLQHVGHRDEAARLARDRHVHDGLASAASAVARGSPASAGSIPRSSIRRAIAEQHARPRRGASTPAPATARTRRPPAAPAPAPWRGPRSPRRADAREPCSTAAARARTSPSARCPARRRSRRSPPAVPTVRVPVLSSTMVSTRLQPLQRLRARGSARRLGAPAGADHDGGGRRQPQRARAGDDQHARPRGERRGRAPARDRTAARPTNVSAAMHQHDRHEDGATRSASRWIGAREPCASSTSATIRASTVSRPTRVAAEDEAAGAVDGAADTVAPGAFSTGRLSPVSIDSSTADAPSTTTPSTGMRSPGRTRSRSPTCTLRRSARRPRRCRATTRAVRGARLTSRRIASEVPSAARASSQRPSTTRVITTRGRLVVGHRPGRVERRAATASPPR